MRHCLVVSSHWAPRRGDIQATVDDLLDLVRGLIVLYDVGVVTQVVNHRVLDDVVLGQGLTDGRDLKHADAQLLQCRIVQASDIDALVAAIG